MCGTHLFIKTVKKSLSLKFIYQAVRNIKPLIELKNEPGLAKGSRRRKPKVVPLPSHRGTKLAISWLIEGAKQRSERTMALRLYRELADAYDKKGYAIKKKIE